MNRVVETNHGIIQNVQNLFAQRMGSDRLELWFQGNERWTLDGESLQIDFDNEFLADCVKSFCLPDLRAVAEEVLGTKARVGIGFDAYLPQNQPEEGQFPKIHSPNPHNGVKPADPVLLKQSRAIDTASSYRAQTASEFPVPIKSGYPTSRETVYRGENQESTTKPWTENRAGMKIDHWAEFIDGQCNRMAKTAAEMVLERPGNLTPLLIHGPCGVGKTHLLRAIAEQLRSRHQLRRVIYLTAEQFTIDFTDSARGSGFASFRKKYRDVDAMLIDDVQFFVGKGATLIELRNTVDNLIRSQRQVIFASDRSLGELAGIGSELHARLSGGMVCALDPLDESCRVSLLQRLCDRYSVSIRPATVETLVRQSSGDARLLHGLAFRILTAQRSMGRSLTEAEVLESCQELLRASQPVVRMSDIERAVCDVFGLEPKSLQAKSKVKTVSQPRMLAMFLARKYTRAAYSEIGQFFGNRQHSTVISAQKKVEDWLQANESMDHSRGSVSVREMIRNLEATLQVG